MNIYKTVLHAKCPINGEWDYYELKIETEDFIKCEDLEKIANGFRGCLMTQEDIADRLASRFGANCKIVLVGNHGQNTDLETWRWGVA